MPIYEYVCRDCDHEFEWLLRGKEKPACPSCGRGHLTKKFSVPAAHTATTPPGCPAQQTGACTASSCCGRDCGMTDFH
ncbi:MAG: hypothetical protein A2V70_07835 [Planctomycetes bacterium RBG_13_63_9]|nr:MAG: hypothetical protein A2V70_07835 [Planctomycetes bacterium RBG_13_63_9]